MKHFKYIACHTILFFHFAILILFILLNEGALDMAANLSSPDSGELLMVMQEMLGPCLIHCRIRVITPTEELFYFTHIL